MCTIARRICKHRVRDINFFGQHAWNLGEKWFKLIEKIKFSLNSDEFNSFTGLSDLECSFMHSKNQWCLINDRRPSTFFMVYLPFFLAVYHQLSQSIICTHAYVWRLEWYVKTIFKHLPPNYKSHWTWSRCDCMPFILIAFKFFCIINIFYLQKYELFKAFGV